MNVWAAAAAGAVAGAVLHVVTLRLAPLGSPQRDAGGCPACAGPFAPWQRVPLAGWLLSRGRCRSCGASLSAREPVLALAAALAFAVAAEALAAVPARLAEGLGLTALLVAVAAVDLEHQIIPNRLVLAGLLWSAAWRGLAAVFPGSGGPGWADGVLGAAVLLALMGVIAAASRGGMGGGDVKFSAVMGMALGWRLGLLALMLAFVAGGGAGLALMALGRKGRRDHMAFGPFLAAATWAVLLWGDALLAALVGRAGGG